VSEQHPHAPSRAGIFTGLVLLALNLRGPLVAVSAVAVDLQADLGMTAGTVGLLTSLPVLCFGLATPAASGVVARLGIEVSVLCTLLGILVGILVRSAGSVPTAFVGTLLIGLAITIGNLLGPLIVGRDFRGRAAQMTGTYTAALNVGSMLVLAVSGPLAAAFGWQLALAAAAIVPLLAGAVWVPLTARAARHTAAVTASVPGDDHPGPAGGSASNGTTTDPPAGRGTPVFRRASTWLLTAAFAGQAYAYYGLTAWMPAVLSDELGMTRGQASAASSFFQIAALVGAFGAPLIINRLGGPLVAFLVNGVLWSALPLGLLLAPGLWVVWSALSGIAQGGGFVTIFTVVVWRAHSLRENRQLSSVVQTGGYCVASLGPTVLGALHDATASWTAALLTTFAGVVVLTVFGASASIGARR
jgi:CP family cyanate transporter-like MFS transporter